ncbi:hypothetical protein A2154_01025 [Candidatus Gottesmanbacteria bacterium RBG_16_43_7]|uniref:Cell division protein FtsL n=1 Tax=Candidatus Gottesmanbacteria bacterium RBG_16_43_7 TaxID=1798373 RepID=A0A1F5Z8S3_9BACT|nr:MAG: hypothetical protein A2154_01025 [Candidatus Gottesmanbacteria bacterium RBG_16_43_7]
MKKFTYFMYGSIFISVSVLFLIQALATNTYVESGRHIDDIESQIDAYTSENEILHKELMSVQSLQHISDLARVAGFTAPQSYLMITQEQPVAFSLH